jgi:hypothetical protein
MVYHGGYAGLGYHSGYMIKDRVTIATTSYMTWLPQRLHLIGLGYHRGFIMYDLVATAAATSYRA